MDFKEKIFSYSLTSKGLFIKAVNGVRKVVHRDLDGRMGLQMLWRKIARCHTFVILSIVQLKNTNILKTRPFRLIHDIDLSVLIRYDSLVIKF